MADYNPGQRKAHDKTKCKMCHREQGLPIMLARYAVAHAKGNMTDIEYYAGYKNTASYRVGEAAVRGRITVDSDSYAKPTDNVLDKNGQKIPLDRHTIYTRRLLRNGYVYLYIPGCKPAEWKGFYVADGGYLEDMGALDFSKVIEYENAPPSDSCLPGSSRLFPRIITIPNYKNYDKMWITFSEVRWTEAVWKRHQNENYRNRHMRVVQLSNLEGDKHALPLNEQNVYTIAEINSDTSGFIFSKAPFVGRKKFQRYDDPDYKSFFYTFLQDLKKTTIDEKAFILTLDDPAGITMDLASLMSARDDAFVQQPKYGREITTSSHIVAFKNSISEQAIKNLSGIAKKQQKKYYSEHKNEAIRYHEITVDEYKRDIMCIQDSMSAEGKAKKITSLTERSPLRQGIISGEDTEGESIVQQMTEQANLVRGILTKRTIDFARQWAWEPYKFNTVANIANAGIIRDANGNKIYDFEKGEYKRPQLRFDFTSPRYDETKREKILKEFDAEYPKFKQAIIKPMAAAHAKWLQSELLAEYMTCNFDGEDKESCKTFTDIFAMCLDGASDKPECMAVIKGWLKDERWMQEADKTSDEKLAALTATDKNLLMRGLMLDCDGMLKLLSTQVGEMKKGSKAPEQKSKSDIAQKIGGKIGGKAGGKIGGKIEKKYNIWDKVIGGVHEHVLKKIGMSKSDIASLTLFEMLAESLTSFIIEETNSPESPKSIPLQLLWGGYNEAPLVTVEVEDTETAFAEFMLKRSLAMSEAAEAKNSGAKKTETSLTIGDPGVAAMSMTPYDQVSHDLQQYPEKKTQKMDDDSYIKNRMTVLSMDGAIPYTPLKEKMKALNEEITALEKKISEAVSGPNPEQGKLIELKKKLGETRDKLTREREKDKPDTLQRQRFIVGIRWEQYVELMGTGSIAEVEPKELEKFREQMDQTVIKVPDLKALEYMYSGIWGSVVESFSTVENFKEKISEIKGGVTAVKETGAVFGQLDPGAGNRNRNLYLSINRKWLPRLAFAESTLGFIESVCSINTAWKAISKAPKSDGRVADAWGKFFAAITASVAASSKLIQTGSSLSFFISKYGKAVSKKWGKFGKTWGKRLGAGAIAVATLISCEEAWYAYNAGNEGLAWLYMGQAALGIGLVALCFCEAPVLAVALFLSSALLDELIDNVKDNSYQKWLQSCCFGSKDKGWTTELEANFFAAC